MRYTVLSTVQLLLLAVIMSVLVATLVSINSWYQNTRLLPEVYFDKAGVCLRVMNYENGQAFNCNDVGVLLRRYRTAKTAQ